MKFSDAIKMVEERTIMTDELRDKILYALKFAKNHAVKVTPTNVYTVTNFLYYGRCRCKELVASSMKYCPECGARLGWDKVTK